MAKAKKQPQEELMKFYEHTKKNLQKLGKEAGIWVKKGEAELSRISKIGKLEIEVVNLNLRKEKLLKDIGKRVVDANLAEEINDSEVRNLSNKLNVILKESKRKKSQMSRVSKRLLRGKPSKAKKKEQAR